MSDTSSGNLCEIIHFSRIVWISVEKLQEVWICIKRSRYKFIYVVQGIKRLMTRMRLMLRQSAEPKPKPRLSPRPKPRPDTRLKTSPRPRPRPTSKPNLSLTLCLSLRLSLSLSCKSYFCRFAYNSLKHSCFFNRSSYWKVEAEPEASPEVDAKAKAEPKAKA